MPAEKTTHIFTASGLGKAPFSYSSPTHPLALKNNAFYCEHCGTLIKNRHFVISTDSIVSVVGIDCLRKTGDEGLVVASKKAIKKERSLARQQLQQSLVQANIAKERQLFYGKTKAESCAAIDDVANKLEEQVVNKIENLDVHDFLYKSAFGCSMIAKAIGPGTFSKSMISAMVAICAKGLSNSRKNSAHYKASLNKANELVNALCVISIAQTKALNEIEKKRIEILNTTIS